MVMPSLSTLLTYSAWEMLSNLSPLFSSSLLYEFDHKLVLELRPRSLDELRVQDLLPSMQALNVGSALQFAGYLLPTFALVTLDRLFKALIL